MTQDEIIELAKEYCSGYEFENGNVFDHYEFSTEKLIAFAKLIAEKEREACAKYVEEYETDNDITATWLNIIADAIRARGQA